MIQVKRCLENNLLFYECQCDCHVPLLTSNSSNHRLNELFDGIFAYLTEAMLNDLRTYLGKTQLSCYCVSSQMQKVSCFHGFWNCNFTRLADLLDHHSTLYYYY